MVNMIQFLSAEKARCALVVAVFREKGKADAVKVNGTLEHRAARKRLRLEVVVGERQQALVARKFGKYMDIANTGKVGCPKTLGAPGRL